MRHEILHSGESRHLDEFRHTFSDSKNIRYSNRQATTVMPILEDYVVSLEAYLDKTIEARL